MKRKKDYAHRKREGNVLNWKGYGGRFFYPENKRPTHVPWWYDNVICQTHIAVHLTATRIPHKYLIASNGSM